MDKSHFLGLSSTSSSSSGPSVKLKFIYSYFPAIKLKSKFCIKTASIILISTIPKCYPMQFLDPAENGMN